MWQKLLRVSHVSAFDVKCLVLLYGRVVLYHNRWREAVQQDSGCDMASSPCRKGLRVLLDIRQWLGRTSGAATADLEMEPWDWLESKEMGRLQVWFNCEPRQGRRLRIPGMKQPEACWRRTAGIRNSTHRTDLYSESTARGPPLSQEKRLVALGLASLEAKAQEAHGGVGEDVQVARWFTL